MSIGYLLLLLLELALLDSKLRGLDTLSRVGVEVRLHALDATEEVPVFFTEGVDMRHYKPLGSFHVLRQRLTVEHLLDPYLREVSLLLNLVALVIGQHKHAISQVLILHCHLIVLCQCLLMILLQPQQVFPQLQVRRENVLYQRDREDQSVGYTRRELTIIGVHIFVRVLLLLLLKEKRGLEVFKSVLFSLEEGLELLGDLLGLGLVLFLEFLSPLERLRGGDIEFRVLRGDLLWWCTSNIVTVDDSYDIRVVVVVDSNSVTLCLLSHRVATVLINTVSLDPDCYSCRRLLSDGCQLHGEELDLVVSALKLH